MVKEFKVEIMDKIIYIWSSHDRIELRDSTLLSPHANLRFGWKNVLSAIFEHLTLIAQILHKTLHIHKFQ
jgi:hypothetical protein